MRRSSPAIALTLVAAATVLGGAVAWLLFGRTGAETPSGGTRGDDRRARRDDPTAHASESPALVAQRDGDATAQRSLIPGRGTLAGRVLAFEDDAPIAGALVELHPEDNVQGPPLATATTGRDGAWRLDDVEPRDTLILIARADGFVSALVTEAHDPVRAGATSTLDAIHLLPGAVVHGRTVDVEGRPLGGVTVGSVALLDPPVASDGDGRFTLRRVPLRLVNVTAAKPGFVTVPTPWLEVTPRTRDANGEIVLRLAPAVALRGRVRTRDGRPFADASVAARIAQPLALRCEASVEHCDPDGRFELAALPAGALAIVSAGSEWFPETAETTVTVGGGEVELVVDPRPLIALDFVDAATGARRAPSHLLVRVLDPRTGPLPETGSDSHDPWDDFEWTASERSRPLRTAADGGIVVPFGRAIEILESKIRDEGSERPSEWRCEVLASAPGCADATVPFRVAAGAAPPAVRIAFEPAGAVLGRVVDADGAPVADASVRLFGVLPDDARGWTGWCGVVVPDDHERWLETRSGADGRFELALTTAPHARAIVRARASGRAAAQTEPFAVDARARTEVTVVLPRGGALAGRVLRGGVGQPQRVVVAWRSDGIAVDARCDDAGNYRFGALAPGRWQVRLGRPQGSHEGHLGATSEGAPPRPPSTRGDVAIVAGATARLDLDLDAPLGQGIRGVVHAPSARRRSMHAFANAVEVVSSDPLFDSGGHPQPVDEEGVFELPDLEPGRWSVVVRAWPHDLVVARAEVVVEEGRWTPVEFEVGARTISGRLFDRASGAPIALDCWLRPKSDDERCGPLVQTRAGADGGFTCEGLLPDLYVLRVDNDFAPLVAIPVDLRDGDALGLEVALDSTATFTVDPKRLAAAGFTLRSLVLERASSLAPLSPRDDGGRLVFDGLLPDTYALVADGATRDGAPRTVRCDVSFRVGRSTDLTDRLLVVLQQ